VSTSHQRRVTTVTKNKNRVVLKKVDLEFLERNSVTPRAYRNRAGRSEKTTDEKSLRARLKRRRIRTYRQLGHPSGLPYNVCDLHTVTQNVIGRARF